MKKGLVKKPSISEASVSSDMAGFSENASILDIDPQIKEELAEKGLSYRWINANKFIAQHGFHRTGWKPYQTEKRERKGALDFGMGVDPEGYIRRGDLVLAVKPEEMQARHRQRLKLKNDLYRGFNKQAADQLRELTRGIGQVYEGYEANDEAKSVGNEESDEE